MVRTPKTRLWFRAKQYGWGWYPVTWEGWLATLMTILLFLPPYLQALRSGTEGNGTDAFWWAILSTLPFIALIILCYRTGEKPSWRWG